jgi:hypothetical protein
MTKFVVDCGVVLHLASDGIAELRRRVKGIVPTATVDALRTV